MLSSKRRKGINVWVLEYTVLQLCGISAHSSLVFLENNQRELLWRHWCFSELSALTYDLVTLTLVRMCQLDDGSAIIAAMRNTYWGGEHADYPCIYR